MTEPRRFTPAQEFRPRRGLRGGHAQTVASNFLPRRNLLPPPEERLFSVEADAQVLCHCHWQPQREDRKTLVIVHGLEGSSESQYVIGNGSKAWRAGMNVVRMNIRNCGGTEKLTPTLYHSGMSADIGAVVQTLIEQDRLTRIALLGYSLGGNQVLKLAGEWGVRAPRELFAVVAVSPSVDLAPGADLLHAWSNRLYEVNFLIGLKSRVRRKARLFPGRYRLPALWRIWSMRDFDDRVTAPHCGFRDAADYYERASASRVVDRIAVPALIVHALDDPFVVVLPQTRAKLLANPNVTYLETAHGGHCGFLGDPSAGDDGRWAEACVQEFLAAF